MHAHKIQLRAHFLRPKHNLDLEVTACYEFNFVSGTNEIGSKPTPRYKEISLMKWLRKKKILK